MALVVCSDCNAKVSTFAVRCPNCGAPVSDNAEPPATASTNFQLLVSKGSPLWFFMPFPLLFLMVVILLVNMQPEEAGVEQHHLRAETTTTENGSTAGKLDPVETTTRENTDLSSSILKAMQELVTKFSFPRSLIETAGRTDHKTELPTGEQTVKWLNSMHLSSTVTSRTYSEPWIDKVFSLEFTLRDPSTLVVTNGTTTTTIVLPSIKAVNVSERPPREETMNMSGGIFRVIVTEKSDVSLVGRSISNHVLGGKEFTEARSESSISFDRDPDTAERVKSALEHLVTLAKNATPAF